MAALVNDTTGRLNQNRSPLPFLVDNARLAGKNGWLGIRAGICGQFGADNCVEHVGGDPRLSKATSLNRLHIRIRLRHKVSALPADWLINC